MDLERPSDLAMFEAGAELTAALRGRRSTKTYAPMQLARHELAHLLWLVAGDHGGRRGYGSAHALYPVQVGVAASDVTGLSPAVYHYAPSTHALDLVYRGDARDLLASMTIDSGWIRECPAVLIFSADLAVLEDHFADQGRGRGTGFAWLETGMLSQNVYLWAASRGLGTCFVGGLRAGIEQHAHTLAPDKHTVLGLQPIGALPEQ